MPLKIRTGYSPFEEYRVKVWRDKVPVPEIQGSFDKIMRAAGSRQGVTIKPGEEFVCELELKILFDLSNFGDYVVEVRREFYGRSDQVPKLAPGETNFVAATVSFRIPKK
jgi:hypothetical protein